MQEFSIHSELVQSVLRTVLVYDVLETKLSLKNIHNLLIGGLATETEVSEVLDFLCVHNILIKLDTKYCLYSKQDEEFSSFDQVTLNWRQRIILPVVSKGWSIDGVALIPRPGKKPVLLSFFDGEVPLRKKEQVSKLITDLTGIRTFHSGIIPVALRNELTAGLLVNAKPILNKTALEHFWQRNSWIFKYCRNAQIDPSLMIKKGSTNKSMITGSLKSTGQFNLSSYLKHVVGKTEYQANYEHRMTYLNQWILPQITKAVKKNRIV